MPGIVMRKYLFVLSPPFSGSTLMQKLLATSKNVSSFRGEGQFVESVKDIMRSDPWDVNKKMPWDFIKKEWHKKWDLNKSILVEKSPPNILRGIEIEKVFKPLYCIAIIRNPYAFCESIVRRRKSEIKDGAEFWIKCAKHQIYNIKNFF